MDHRRTLTSLESARFLTDVATIREYEAAQIQKIRQPGYFEQRMENIKFRIMVRTLMRFVLFILAIALGLTTFFWMNS